MDIQLLKLFVNVFDARSVSEAAIRLKISQPSASAALGRLRFRMKDHLFVKTQEGMQPTSRATSMYPYISEIVRLYEENVACFDSHSIIDTPRCFSIAISEDGENMMIPRILELARSRFNNITFRFVPVYHRNVGSLLENGEVDLVYGHFPSLNSLSIKSSLIARFNMALFCSSDNPILSKDVHPQDISVWRYVSVDPGGNSDHAMDRWFSENGITANIVARVTSFSFAAHIVENSDLVTACVASSDPSKEFGRDTIKRIPINIEIPSGECRIYWHERQHQDPIHGRMRSLIPEALSYELSLL